MKEKFEKIVKFGMPYDKRDIDPKKNYGISSMRIWFILKGKNGAVQILINTNCYLNSVIKEIGVKLFYNDTFDCWDIGYHSHKPMYDGQTKTDCDLYKNGCYYEGSSSMGKTEKIVEGFQEKGEKFIWDYLEKYYLNLFGDKK